MTNAGKEQLIYCWQYIKFELHLLEFLWICYTARCTANQSSGLLNFITQGSCIIKFKLYAREKNDRRQFDDVKKWSARTSGRHERPTDRPV